MSEDWNMVYNLVEIHINAVLSNFISQSWWILPKFILQETVHTDGPLDIA